MTYVLGLDGGGTKTAAILRDENGNRLGAEVFGPMNFNSAPDAARNTLTDCFHWLDRHTDGISACSAVCLGSAGVSNPDARRFLTDCIRGCGYGGPLSLVGDHITAMAGAFGKPVGTVLISGTGSICFARTETGQERRVGGWGHLIDDEGSGYAVGRDILSAVVRAADGRGPATALSGLAARQLGSPEIGAVIRFTYAPDTGKKEIAALAPLLSEALRQGDAAAKDILSHAAQELTEMASAAIRPLGLENGEFAMLGSMLEKNEYLRSAVKESLSAQFASLRFPAVRGTAADGAATIALSMLEEKEK